MLLFFLLIIYCNGQDQEIRDGDAAFIKLKYDEAIKFYTNAINLDPGNIRAYYKRATVHQQRRSFREAMSDLNEVVQLDPDYHLAVLARGKLNKDLGKFSQAKQDIEKVATTKKESAVKGKAKKELEEILLLEGYIKEGNELLDSLQYQAAKVAFSKAIDKAPQWVAARLSRAKAALGAKQYSDVIEDTLKVLKITPNDVNAIQLRAQAFRYLGELDNSEKLYEGCLSWDKSNSVCIESFEGLKKWRATYQSAEKRIDSNLPKLALNDIEFCLSYDPEWDFFRNKLKILKAKALLKQNNYDETIVLCDEVLASEEISTVYIIKGDVYLAKENFDEAVRQYEKASNLGDNGAQEKLRNAQKQQKMASRKDYYKILGLTKSASANDIKKAYRKLAMSYHPDKMKTATPEEKENANTKMKEIGEAYAILSDAEKKATYDRGDEFDHQQQGNPFYGFQGFQGFQGFNFKFN